jgi:hypothetical protein
MPLLTNQPDNINFLSPLAFKFTLSRSPNLNFFVTDVNIPSIELGFTEVPTPFKPLQLAGDKLVYGDLILSFKVDEDFANYFEIYNWIKALGHPESFYDYKKLKNAKSGNKEKILSDATLMIFNSAYLPNIEIQFEDLFPTSIGNIDFNTTDTDVNYVTNTVTFKYKIFKVKKL